MDSLSAFITESFHLPLGNNGLSTQTRLLPQTKRFVRRVVSTEGGNCYGESQSKRESNGQDDREAPCHRPAVSGVAQAIQLQILLRLNFGWVNVDITHIFATSKSSEKAEALHYDMDGISFLPIVHNSNISPKPKLVFEAPPSSFYSVHNSSIKTVITSCPAFPVQSACADKNLRCKSSGCRSE